MKAECNDDASKQTKELEGQDQQITHLPHHTPSLNHNRAIIAYVMAQCFSRTTVRERQQKSVRYLLSKIVNGTPLSYHHELTLKHREI